MQALHNSTAVQESGSKNNTHFFLRVKTCKHRNLQPESFWNLEGCHNSSIPKVKPVLAQLHASLPHTLREPELCGLLILLGSLFFFFFFFRIFFGCPHFSLHHVCVEMIFLMCKYPQEIKNTSAFINAGCDKCNSEVALYSSFFP